MKTGDRVVMNGKYYVADKNMGKVFNVVAGPQEVCGTPCVWLEDYHGCYAADGLGPVDTKRHLCDSCSKGFPTCDGEPELGDGLGNDNVIQCSNFRVRG